MIWQGNRQGDFNERLRLYQRAPTQTVGIDSGGFVSGASIRR
jgi:hypothetical protein